MNFIIAVACIIYFILIAWTWQSLGLIEKIKKIVVIIIGLILMYGITLIVFQTTKGGIDYQNIEIQKRIQNILVVIFTGMNGIIVMPQIGKLVDKINENQITKEQLIKKVGILVMIFIICLIFESEYMKNTQQGILNVYHAMK